MTPLFVDTAGWMACADQADPAHRRAVAARDRWLERGGRLVTTDYVADETLTLVLRFACDGASLDSAAAGSYHLIPRAAAGRWPPRWD
ncbi:MAG: hypothetical protein KGS61_11895 [Verrucomicrobia bacterium]|nr:hypothetical protein [Verrucomicrobiota bacterium]